MQRLYSKMDSSFATKCVNTIRVLSADTVEKANSGHPGEFAHRSTVHEARCLRMGALCHAKERV
jgi:hypothetical protein